MSTVTIPEEKLQSIEAMAQRLLMEVADLRSKQASVPVNEKPHVKRALDRFRKNQTRVRQTK
jgi:hypothetical protein